MMTLWFMLRTTLFRIALGTLGGLSIAAYAQTSTAVDPAAKRRPVTVADAIEMTQVGDRSYLENLKGTGNVVQFSPDGSKFAFVTQKGDIKSDTVEFSLLLFQTAEAFPGHRGEVVASMASSSNREAIREVKWLPDNENVVFLGEEPGGTPQIYKVNTTTKKLEKLTSHPTPIIDYSMSERGDNFVFVAEVAPRPVLTNEMLSDGFFVTSQQWQDLYTNREAFDTRHEIYVKTPKIESPQRAGDVFDTNPATMGLSVSPNGQYALLRAYKTSSPPPSWKEYQYKDDGEDIPSDVRCAAGETLRCHEQFYVVDLFEKTMSPLLDAPLVTKRQIGYPLAAWTRESSVFIINALLPLDSVDGQERNRRLNHVYAAEVALPGRSISKISEREKPYSVFYLEYGDKKDHIIAKTGVGALGPPLEFYKESNGWKIGFINGSTADPDNHLSVSLDQDMNTPPKLVISDPKTKRKAVFFDLNPQFSQLTFGRVETYQWKTPHGEAAEGILYYPPDYVAGNRYPLIIQTHGERRERFWIDGPYSTAYAAQPLANQGFLVLQIGLADIYDKASVKEVDHFFSTAKEGPHYAELFDSAIESLDQKSLIDPMRVGLSGFSRTAFHVLYALTHPIRHIAAAVAADGVNFGYVDCVYDLARINSSLCEAMNEGGPPYGNTLVGWAKSAPGFRLDKVDAPLLLQAISEPIGEWEIFAGLQWLKKPVEMVNFYPQGDHVLVRPRQRLLSQGSVVDWYCFWLKGEEDPDPAKTEMYTRWREMKRQRDQNYRSNQ